MCPGFIFVASWEQPMISDWDKGSGYFFFHKPLPARFIFKKKGIKMIVIGAILNTEIHSN